MSTFTRSSTLTAGLLLAGLSCLAIGADESATPRLLQDARSHFSSITAAAADAAKNVGTPQVELGRKLFFDPRMSADGVWSCMLCHQPSLYGTDAQPLSRGVFDKFLTRNAPTVLNASLQFKSHWDGKFESVEDQAEHALLGPGFGNKDNAEAMSRIKAIPGYDELFRQAFPNEPEPINPQNYAKAVGLYERTLLTPAKFDGFLDGNTASMSSAEQQGLRLFIQTGCVNCHNQAGIGGHTFEKFGEVSDYWTETHSKVIDKGRFTLTKNEEDLYVFKVPSLRNVVMTPPYFHDGSVTSLSDAVQIMGKVQLGVDLSMNDVQSIVLFLNTLTGPIPQNFDDTPILPTGTFHAQP